MIDRIKGLLAMVGPGLIIASVCLGPGSVTTASTIGADYGYALIWVVVLSSSAMMMYTVMAARFGATHQQSFLQVVAQRYHRGLAVLIGLAAFLMSASFQFGNNLGVSAAMTTITGWERSDMIWPFLFTGVSLLLVAFAKDLYNVIEKVMIALVALMVGSFLANLIPAGPDLGEALGGLVPSIPPGDEAITRTAAMVGTTFVVHACLYQAYLVQSKGWGLDDIRKSTRDSVLGISFLALISILIMLTSATVLRPRGVEITGAAEMAMQLEDFFGPWARVIFCLGLWAAAFSSISVNAIVGGGLLADGLGLGHRMGERWPRVFAVAIMVAGMLVATVFRENKAQSLVLAQAATMLAVPAVVVGMFVVLNDRRVMGAHANTWRANIVAGFGLLLVLVMSYATYGKLLRAVEDARGPRPSATGAEAATPGAESA